ncbi:MAG: oligopeptide:H+ symporter [Coriobacteriales bacterium]|jgi:POT family proton-dependent oligopeptide transporter|nr:oligopeptide:H+ symporter [Coriobacteriales bacterium]
MPFNTEPEPQLTGAMLTASEQPQIDPPHKKHTLFGHPLGLFNLFSTEVCERFSYYGMKSILVLFLFAAASQGGLGLDKAAAMSITSLFSAFVYLSSAIGGWVADRLLGQKRSVVIGGAVIALGHILLGFPLGLWGVVVALACICLGTGLLKPNVSALVGALYGEGDPRRQSAFSIYYFGINLGSFFSPLIVGLVAQTVGYHPAFVIPAVMMIIGLIIFTTTQKATLGHLQGKPANPLSRSERARYAAIAVGVVVLVALLLLITNHVGILSLAAFTAVFPLICLVIVAVIFASIIGDRAITKVQRQRVVAFIPIFIALTAFFAIYDQQFATVPVIADERLFSNLGGFIIPASWYQSVNPVTILIVTPFFAWLWAKWGKRQPGIIAKMVSGMVLAAASMFLLGVVFLMHADGSQFSPAWMLLVIFMFSVGELLVSPTSLGATSEYAPPTHASQLMGIWMISDSVSQGINSFTVNFYNEAAPAPYFMAFGVVVIVVALVFLCLKRPIEKWSHGIRF